MDPYRNLLLVLFLFSVQCIEAQDRYTISIDDLAERIVRVNAIVHPKGDLLMSPFGAEHLEMGWGTFVEELNAKSAEGHPIPIEMMPGGTIQIGSGSDSLIELDYSINLRHQQHHWPFGHKEAAYVLDGMLMSTGNALFITQLEMDSAVVEFRVPANYKIATAWRKTSENTYSVKGAEELVWTVMAIGEFERTTFPAGTMNVELVHGSQLQQGAPLLRKIAEEAITEYERIFGGAPQNPAATGGTYLQVINVDTTYEGGGSAFTNSISILLNKPPSVCADISSSCWHHIVVHELGHLWISLTLKADDRDQWFLEGFTDHLAFHVQRDLGLWDQEQWKSMLEMKRQEYGCAKATANVSLADAGEDKSGNYDLIYAGGLLFAHDLDMEITTRTGNKRSLTDLFRVLYSMFAGSDQLIDRVILQKEAETVCECLLEGLFARLDAVE